MTKQEILDQYLKIGDTITHTRCMGCVEEHIYTRKDGIWYCGTATKDTVRLGGIKGETHDIHVNNITHINRTPVESVPFLAENSPESDIEQARRDV